MGVFDAAQSSRVEALTATRDALARAIDDAPATVLAQLTKQFRDTLAELEDLTGGPARESTPLDEFTERLNARNAAAAARHAAGG